MKRIKQTIAFALALFMLCGTIPQTVFASETNVAPASETSVLESNIRVLKDYVSEYGMVDGNNKYLSYSSKNSSGDIETEKLFYLADKDMLKFQSSFYETKTNTAYLLSFEFDPVNSSTFTISGLWDSNNKKSFNFESAPIDIASFTNSTRTTFTFTNLKNLSNSEMSGYSNLLNEYIKNVFYGITLLLIDANGLSPANIGFDSYYATTSEIMAQGTCGSAVTYMIRNGALIISGKGAMTNFGGSSGPWHYNYSSKITSVYIEEGVTSVGDYAFWNLPNVKSVTIPDSVTHIGDYAFYGAESLSRLRLSDNVEMIEGFAFANCTSLTEFKLPEKLVATDDGVFSGCINLNKVIVPEGLIVMDSGAFVDCPKLKTVGPYGSGSNIEIGWTSVIPEYAFQRANYITSVVIPDGVTTISASAFNGASALKEITIPRSVKIIGSKAFASVDSLTDVYYLGSLEKWNTINFNMLNSSLTEATIHTVELLEQEIKVEQDAYKVSCGTPAFSLNAAANTALTYQSDNQNVATVSADGVVTLVQPGTAVITISAEKTDDYFDATKEITIIFVDANHTYGAYVSDNNMTCTEDGTKTAHCSVCGSKDTITDENSLLGHSFTKYIENPPTCENDGTKVATCDRCPEKDTIVLEGTSTGHSFGDWVETKAPTYDTEGIETRICAACKTEETRNIPCIPMEGSCGSNATYILAGDTLTIRGTGAMTNYAASSSVPWYRNRAQIKKVIIESGITSVGAYSFNRVSYLTEVSLPDTLETIGTRAFDGCQNLAGIELPYGLKTIESYAFEDVPFSKLVIPATVKTLATGWIENSNATFTTAGPIGSGADVEYGWTDVIPENAFRQMRTLETVEVAAGIHTIGMNAFYYCTNLERVTLPASVKIINTSAFSSCNMLSEIYYYGSSSDWSKIFIGSWGNTPLLNATVCYFGWQQIGGSWYYRNADGELLTGKQQIDGVNYLFRADGSMVTGWYSENGNWYYCNSSGALQIGWFKSGSAWYYTNNDGVMVTGKQTIDGIVYFFNSDGSMKTGWILDEDKWYYYTSDGSVKTGWFYVSGAYYYGKQDGSIMVNEWLDDLYYFNKDGAMVTGWQELDGDYYYFRSSGEKVANAWSGSYWLKADGVMATSEWVDGGKYYVDANGVYKTGWLELEGRWYYLGGSGLLQKGWINDGGTWYYGNETGALLEEEWLDDTYYFQKGGAMVTGWYLLGEDYYYFYSSGSKAASTWVGNYYMKADGVMATSEWVDGERYYVDENGVWDPSAVKES